MIPIFAFIKSGIILNNPVVNSNNNHSVKFKEKPPKNGNNKVKIEIQIQRRVIKYPEK